jgi:hypothetical protein
MIKRKKMDARCKTSFEALKAAMKDVNVEVLERRGEHKQNLEL